MSPAFGDDASIDRRWREILDAVVAVQAVLPDAVLIGGSAITLHTSHRLSGDADLVKRDLDREWHRVRAELEELEGWITDYPKIPTNMMGRYRDARVSVRKLNRVRDLEVTEIDLTGSVVRVAAPDELVRMKGLAILNRSLARDFVDVVALDDGLREVGRTAAHAIAEFDEYYREISGSGSPTRELVSLLADPQPRDAAPQAALDELVGLRDDLRDWDRIRMRCQRIAAEVE